MVKIIIFDLGGVILKFDHHITTRRISDMSGIPEPKIYNYIFCSELEKLFDTGKIGAKDFFNRVMRGLNINLGWEDFRLAWADIFQVNPGIEGLLRELKEKFKLCLLSNTNEIHFDYVKEKFPILNIFDEYFLSYKLHSRKPDSEIFKAVLDRYKVDPQECIYIDDVQEYVDKASEIGLMGIRYINTENLRK
jgi:glucose-1-phosphatase